MEMTQWHRVTLSNADMLSGKAQKLQEEFFKSFMAAGCPRSAAMFSSSLFAQERIRYFSPDSMTFARAIVAAYSGTPCDPPTPDVALLVGDDSAWEKLIGG